MEAPRKIVLDTDVMVHHLRGREESALVNSLQERSSLATTMINAYELYYGAYRSKNLEANLSHTKAFLSSIDVLTLDERSAEKSAQVLAELESKRMGIDPRDLFTGCIAAENGYAVLTLNRKHFERIPGLLVLAPSQLK